MNSDQFLATVEEILWSRQLNLYTYFMLERKNTIWSLLCDAIIAYFPTNVRFYVGWNWRCCRPLMCVLMPVYAAFCRRYYRTPLMISGMRLSAHFVNFKSGTNSSPTRWETHRQSCGRQHVPCFLEPELWCSVLDILGAASRWRF